LDAGAASLAAGGEVVEFAGGGGWPVTFFDENCVRRLTIKNGSRRAPGSNFPRVEVRNATECFRVGRIRFLGSPGKSREARPQLMRPERSRTSEQQRFGNYFRPVGALRLLAVTA
jgi:hypothetical protein